MSRLRRALPVLLLTMTLIAGRARAACQDVVFAREDETSVNDRSRHVEDNVEAAYMLRGFVAFDGGAAIHGDASGALRLPCQLLGAEALAALQSASPAATVLPFDRLQRAWTVFNLHGFPAAHEAAAIPASLAEFARRTGFERWPREVLDVSPIKQKTRVIFRSPAGVAPRVRVSQTHDERDGDLTTPVRETELALERPDGSGDWDFYVYDRDGSPSAFSEFPTGYKSVPTICVGCHYNVASGRIGRIFDEH